MFPSILIVDDEPSILQSLGGLLTDEGFEVIEATNGYARGLLHGVARYIREHGKWTVYFEPRAPQEPPPPWLKGWKGDGVLARVANQRMAKAVLALGVPVVDIDPENLPVAAHESDSYYRFKYSHKTHERIRPPRAHQIPQRIDAELKKSFSWFYRIFYPGLLSASQ